jgi:PadR family transcriptional regulator
MNRERIKGHLDLLLLSVLAAGPAHGYAIISALRERSDGTFDLPEGTIYPAFPPPDLLLGQHRMLTPDSK